MKRYAIVGPDNIVKNIIVWDGASAWTPPEEHIMVDVEEVFCDIGCIHDNGVFSKPPEPEAPQEPSQP